jgi:NADPH:quinone reductase-like Zn-dependent oxidoreductase
MKAVICKKYGPPEVLEVVEVPKPVPAKNQVLIRIRAAAVNSGDVRVRALSVGTGLKWEIIKFIFRCIVGFTGPRRKILGIVLAGEVVETGSAVTSFKAGDRVFAMTGLQFGAYAEYATVAESQSIAHMPIKASFEEAAALPFGGTTALYFLRKAGIEKAKKVLIYGSSGSVGTSAVQVAKYYGADVSAVSGEDGIALSRELGANTVYNYKEQTVKEITDKFDIVFDAVGKITRSEIKHLLLPHATFVTVDSLDTAKETSADLKQLAYMFDEGAITAVIDRVYDLSQIVEAHRYVDTGRKKGNVIVRI